ncbi:MAG: ABC transporter permease, partial [Acetobacteraceae bacterium]
MRRPYWLSAAGLAAFLGVWEAAVRAGLLPAAWVPAPDQVPAAFLSELRNGEWTAAVLASLTHYLAGVAAGSLLGIAAGVAVALSPGFAAAQSWVARMLRP